MNSTSHNTHRPAAFTLIEMLVVIAVIGILAGMFIGIYPAVNEKRVRARVKAEIALLVIAIEDFKKDQGFYPPDNRNNFAAPPLYYELVGCNLENDQFVPTAGGRPIQSASVKNALSVDGFVNTGILPIPPNKPSKNYLPGLNPDQHGYTTNTTPWAEVLLVPYRSVDGDFNPWRYNSSSPEHNPGSFDLWAEIDLGKRDAAGQKVPVIIGNWRQ